VQEVVDRWGQRAPAAILAAVADGHSFEEAFQQATGTALATAAADFTGGDLLVPLDSPPHQLGHPVDRHHPPDLLGRRTATGANGGDPPALGGGGGGPAGGEAPVDATVEPPADEPVN